MSRIFSGRQELKLSTARAMAQALGVGLDYLVEDREESGDEARWETLTNDEAAVLRIVRRLGVGESLDRLLAVPEGAERADSRTKKKP
jgi:transcriptional regulator with XRE-family HTH domain